MITNGSTEVPMVRIFELDDCLSALGHPGRYFLEPMSTCPHCSEVLPIMTDAFCPYCHEPLNDPEKQDAAIQESETNPNVELNSDRNPYAAPSAGSRRAGVILYTELPRRCPNCDKKFSEVNFRRRFKRKMRWTTISYILFVSIGGYVLLALILPALLFWPIYLVLVIPVLGHAMTWPKMVKMSCFACNWKQTFVVAGSGAKRI